MKTLRKLNHRGDTIIEVLMALAVLSLSLGISYATANNGLNRSRTAEEHSEALGLLDDQVEKLRTSISSNLLPPASFFCMTPTGGYSSTFPNPYSSSYQQDSQNGYSHYPASCKSGIYNISISSTGSDYGYTNTPAVSPETDYTFTIRWNGIGTIGPQQESINYRIGSTLVGLGNYLDPQAVITIPNSNIVINGADYSTCAGYSNGDGFTPDSCHPGSSSTSGPVYSWSNYDVSYTIASLPPGNYKYEIIYQNNNNGSWPPPSTGNYKYNVVTTLTGNSSNPTLNLPTSAGSYVYDSPTFTVGAPQTNATLNLNWNNNQWIDSNGNGEGVGSPSPGSFDPNLQIDSITLEAQ